MAVGSGAAVAVDLVALLLSLLALLLANRGVLAWTAVDTAGHSSLAQSHFCLVPRRLTRERPLVQVQHGPLTFAGIRRCLVLGR